MANAATVTIDIQRRITCPHCWEEFPAEKAVWLSEHPDLEGDDPRLGAEQAQRFLPTRFDATGNAIDEKGGICRDLACPRCHLVLPRAVFELRRFFISIAGEQASGKSYFLASMTRMLRQSLPTRFSLAFADADPVANQVINEYEEVNFLNADRETPVKLAKTEEAGHMYNEVRFGEHYIRFARPYFFSIRPAKNHPSQDDVRRVSRVLIMYDNAGESFRPGADRASAPVTRHLALCNALIFLFDPTQDTRFRSACMETAVDPQIRHAPVRNHLQA